MAILQVEGRPSIATACERLRMLIAVAPCGECLTAVWAFVLLHAEVHPQVVGHVAELLHLAIAKKTVVESCLTAWLRVLYSRSLVVLLEVFFIRVADCFSNCLWFRLLEGEWANRLHSYVFSVWDCLRKRFLLMTDFLRASYVIIRHGIWGWKVVTHNCQGLAIVSLFTALHLIGLTHLSAGLFLVHVLEALMIEAIERLGIEREVPSIHDEVAKRRLRS